MSKPCGVTPMASSSNCRRILFAGCVQPMPKVEGFFQLTPQSAQYRALQTRTFETTDEKELLSASAAVLQDLGFQVEESVKEVGMLRAAKERGAREYGQEIMQSFIVLLSGVAAAWRADVSSWFPSMCISKSMPPW